MEHKHYDVIKAWAADTTKVVQVRYAGNGWQWSDCITLLWDEECEYRIKPEPKPDVVTYVKTLNDTGMIQYNSFTRTVQNANLKLTFDGETGQLKSAEVL